VSVDFFPVPMTELLFTQRCNMACTYCFEPKKKQNRMSKEQILDFVEKLPSIKIMMFGGEPFLDIDLLTDLYDALEAKDMNETLKTQLLQSFTIRDNLITNGTLIEKNLDIIKKYNLMLQISVDGPKEINDLGRVYADGHGSFDDIMKSIDFCIKNNLHWCTHGAVTPASFKYLDAVFAFNWDIAKKQSNGDIENAISSQGSNNFQIIFEAEYTDEDIDNFLIGQEKVFNAILSLEEINQDQKIRLLQGYFCRHGSACIAGNVLMAVDPDLNVYPCHRPAMDADKEKNSLGNLKDRSTFKNFKLFNTYLELNNKRKMYSAIKNADGNDGKSGFAFQQNWCPAANLETSGTVFYQSAKYNLMIAEYDRFVKEIFEYAKIPLPN
jgi:uncharacterized protein